MNLTKDYSLPVTRSGGLSIPLTSEEAAVKMSWRGPGGCEPAEMQVVCSTGSGKAGDGRFKFPFAAGDIVTSLKIAASQITPPPAGARWRTG